MSGVTSKYNLRKRPGADGSGEDGESGGSKRQSSTQLNRTFKVLDNMPECTEDQITKALDDPDINISQYANIDDVPPSTVSKLLEKLGHRKAAGREQELLDFFGEILVSGAVEVPIIAKALRYLSRKDRTTKKAAFVIVDVQNDFISGALALRNTPGKQEGAEVVPVINDILQCNDFAGVFYTIDWHPQDHCSYVTNVSKYKLHESSAVKAEDAKVMDVVVYEEPKVLDQVMWPEHCLQGSEGAELHPDLVVVEDGIKIYKGQIPNVDSYSGVWDNGKLSRSELLGHLFDRDITEVYVCGLATDFCVGFTALDIVEHGFHTFVVMDACRGVTDESIKGMKKKMKKAGCKLIKSKKIRL